MLYTVTVSKKTKQVEIRLYRDDIVVQEEIRMSCFKSNGFIMMVFIL